MIPEEFLFLGIVWVRPLRRRLRKLSKFVVVVVSLLQLVEVEREQLTTKFYLQNIQICRAIECKKLYAPKFIKDLPKCSKGQFNRVIQRY